MATANPSVVLVSVLWALDAVMIEIALGAPYVAMASAQLATVAQTPIVFLTLLVSIICAVSAGLAAIAQPAKSVVLELVRWPLVAPPITVRRMLQGRMPQRKMLWVKRAS